MTSAVQQRSMFQEPLGQRGQIFAGYFVVLLVIAALTVSVLRYVTAQHRATSSRIYEEHALNVARAGFEDALSYFRRQPDGVYLDPGIAPVDQRWVTPWPEYPDYAFKPGPKDTDNFAAASVSVWAASDSTFTARAILRSFPLFLTSSLTNSAEMRSSPLWGRYVVRRQNERNWSPGSNTATAANDPEAAHDLTHIRGTASPGAGNVWGLTSRGYVYAYPGDLTAPAMHEGDSLVSPPKRFLNGKRLLMASAKVYGELYRMNFNYPNVALYVGNGYKVTVNANAVVNGASAQGLGRGDLSNARVNAGGSIQGGVLNVGRAPGIGGVFPGLSKSVLRGLADKVGGIECLPRADDPDISSQSSRTSFLFITTTGLAGNRLVFAPGASSRVLSGVGLAFIEGSLEVQAKSLSAWSGMLFVEGDVVLRGPAEVSGILIATGSVTLGASGDLNKAIVEFNPDSLAQLQAHLQNFQVLKSSIVATVP